MLHLVNVSPDKQSESFLSWRKNGGGAFFVSALTTDAANDTSSNNDAFDNINDFIFFFFEISREEEWKEKLSVLVKHQSLYH